MVMLQFRIWALYHNIVSSNKTSPF